MSAMSEKSEITELKKLMNEENCPAETESVRDQLRYSPAMLDADSAMVDDVPATLGNSPAKPDDVPATSMYLPRQAMFLPHQRFCDLLIASSLHGKHISMSICICISCSPNYTHDYTCSSECKLCCAVITILLISSISASS